MTRSLMLCACLFTANLASGCDQADDSGPEYRDQLDDAAITLEDAIDPVTEQIEAVVVDATFELGVDDGFYLVEAVEGEDLVVYEVDARTGERVVGERVRARPERLELARRHHAARRRLAQLVREIRAEHADVRAPAQAVDQEVVRDDVELHVDAAVCGGPVRRDPRVLGGLGPHGAGGERARPLHGQARRSAAELVARDLLHAEPAQHVGEAAALIALQQQRLAVP